MGDRVYVSGLIGGQLARADVAAFLDALENDGAVNPETYDLFGADDLESWPGGALPFGIDECNYANPADLLAFCREKGLPYFFQWDQGGGFGPGLQVWPGAGDPRDYAGVEGDAALTETQAKALGSFESILNYFKGANWRPDAFSIVEAAA